MGSLRKQVSSAPPPLQDIVLGGATDDVYSVGDGIDVVGGDADDVCVVGDGIDVVGGDADDVCVGGDGTDVVGGDADYVCVVGDDIDAVTVDSDAVTFRKAEMILTGSDALRFLYANSGTGKHTGIMKSGFPKLFSKMQTGESTVSRLKSPPPTNSVLPSARKQRKAYRPSRFPSLEEVESLPLKKESRQLVLDDVSLKVHDHRKGKKKGFSGNRAMKDSHELPSMANGLRNKQLSLLPNNAVVLCKNLACKAVLQAGTSFCRRCSCCICKKFDDNKDPSLWITCDSEEEGCGLSCHLECALQNGVAGVIKKRGSPLLDGRFACKSCGLISSLIGLWRRQLLVAKGARRVDVLCHRLFLSHRLLKGTLKYKDAYTVLDDAVKKLEAEVSLMNKGSAKLERCIVKRLSCNTEVQEMIDVALERAESLGDARSAVLDIAHDAATCEKASCTMRFEDVCSSSIVVVAVNNHASNDILGYKLWHKKATSPRYPEAPTYTIQSPSEKFLVSDLQSCTSYVFKLAPFSSHGDRGECEAECFTEAGMDSTVLVENHENDVNIRDDDTLREEALNHGATNPQHHSFVKSRSIRRGNADGHGVRLVGHSSRGKAPFAAKVDGGKDDAFTKVPSDAHDLGHPFTIQRLMISEKDGFCNGMTSSGGLEKGREELFVSREAADEIPLSLARGVNANNASAGSQSWAMQLHCYDAQSGMLTKDIAHDSRRDGFLHNANFYSSEFSIKVIRWLECQGHLDKLFRMKFFTWYSLRATEHEKRVVSIFIDTLGDSPASLAAQLVDAFQEIIVSKKQRGYFEGSYQ